MNKGKIMYVAGPIDADHVYRCWLKKEEDQSYFGTRYLTQFYQVCHEQLYEPYVIAPEIKNKKLQKSEFDNIEYWKPNLERKSGFLYHLGQLILMLKIVYKALMIRAEFVVVIPGRPYWFVLTLLSFFGIRVIPSIHCVLWPKFGRMTKAQSLFMALTSYFFSKTCLGIMVASDDIGNQVKEITRSKNRPIYEFLPTYSRNLFSINVSSAERKGFRVLFVGRIEKNKGVYTLLEIARQLKDLGNQDIYFDVCGTGAALDSLISEVHASNLETTFLCHGFCNKPIMKKFYLQSDVVVVPTTIDFIEGFNQVVCEAILAGKPVISSEVCPSVSKVREAVLVVQPNDLDGYKKAILDLYNNKDLYKQKQDATHAFQEQFFDPKNGWGQVFKELISNQE